MYIVFSVVKKFDRRQRCYLWMYCHGIFKLLSSIKNSLSVEFWIFFTNIYFRDLKNAFFTEKYKLSQKNIYISLEEYVLIESHISIGIIIFLSLFEIIGAKVKTLVLYPLFRFQEIVKDCNVTELRVWYYDAK